MAKTKKSKAKNPGYQQMDSVFVLKLVLFLILGSQWLYIIQPNGGTQIPIPVGAIVGVLFASHEHFKIDRKIEYALLLLAMFISYWLPMGITIVN
ncbi:MAG: hypothetical protein NTX11_03000 [Candidatus Saccharibacteria bacterium]|nr:hypothetical protein [Candidatus Saccharibacteria bacterium]